MDEKNFCDDKERSVTDEVCNYWSRVIDQIVRDIVKKSLRSMWVEQYAEVEIISVDISNNTVTCRNIQTEEKFSNVPNYSNFDLTSLIGEDGKSRWGNDTKARGRMFMTNIKDNPYYLGVWYN